MRSAQVSIFGNILHKIFNHPAKAAPSRPAPAAAAPEQQPGQAAAPAAAPVAPAPAPATTPASVDVGAVLSEMAGMKGGGGNYETSIVDLLKLLDLDSSLTARKELADELGVHAGADGSAEQNIALHKAVMQKLSESGGIVPDAWRS
jgi:pyruvate/2-oxoglutarate dehydrogenase complex dihydrolipoamide acyltransferase (E2) component